MPAVSPDLPTLDALVESSFHLLDMVMLSSFTNRVAVFVVPDIFTPSLICMAVLSALEILLISKVETFNVPVMSTDSASVILVESSELTVVPFTLRAPNIKLPVPDAEMVKSSLLLVPVIALSLIVTAGNLTAPTPPGCRSPRTSSTSSVACAA
jgi:hypothetical protein